MARRPAPHERRRRTRAAPSLLRHASAIASRYKHFALLDQLLVQEFGSLVPSQALPGKRAFGNLQPQFVEERKAALARYLQRRRAQLGSTKPVVEVGAGLGRGELGGSDLLVRAAERRVGARALRRHRQRPF